MPSPGDLEDPPLPPGAREARDERDRDGLNPASAGIAASSADKIPDSNTLSIAPEPSDVPALVERARSTILSAGGRQSVLVDLPTGLPSSMANRRRVVRVLNNLSPTPPGPETESTPLRLAAGLDSAHVAISASDKGRGLEPDLLPHLFRKHGGGRAGATAGHRLGLALCKGLVEAHGGRIRPESAGADRGTTFTFTLPAAGEADAEAPWQPRRPAAGLRTGRAVARPHRGRRPADAAPSCADALSRAGCPRS